LPQTAQPGRPPAANPAKSPPTNASSKAKAPGNATKPAITKLVAEPAQIDAVAMKKDARPFLGDPVAAT